MTETELIKACSAYWQSATIRTAVELELFAELVTCMHPAVLAKSKGFSAPHLEQLLNSLAAIGVLQKEGDCFRIHERLLPYLDPNLETCIIPALQFNRYLEDIWKQLPETIRTGKPSGMALTHLGKDPAFTTAFVQAMKSRASILVRELTPVIDFEDHKKVLDLGGNTGMVSHPFLDIYPNLSIVVMDLPPIVKKGKPSERLQFYGGDYHLDPLPKDWDCILYCGALHQETPESARALFCRLKKKAPRRTPLWIVDFMVDESKTQPSYSTLFGLNMMLLRPTSHMHSVRDICEMFNEPVEILKTDGLYTVLKVILNP